MIEDINLSFTEDIKFRVVGSVSGSVWFLTYLNTWTHRGIKRQIAVGMDLDRTAATAQHQQQQWRQWASICCGYDVASPRLSGN